MEALFILIFAIAGYAFFLHLDLEDIKKILQEKQEKKESEEEEEEKKEEE